ncbi:hypothetical protein TNCV_3608491 [Trichonephila clavipes]|nr:hypothetical protein TNCV_3608491 [Trichonephila clavipes]
MDLLERLDAPNSIALLTAHSTGSSISNCKDLLPAPGNRSNETHDIERRTWQREERRVGTREERKAVGKKTWSDKEETTGRCVL